MSDTKNARTKFKKGDRVKPTAYGLKSLGSMRINAGTRGTVIGFSRQPQLVAIRRDGRKSRETYHVEFWERAAATPPSAEQSTP